MKARERTYIAIILALAVHAVVLLLLHEFPQRHVLEPTFFAEVDLADFPDVTEEEVETHTLEELIAERIQQDVANLVADANSERTDQRSNYMSQAARDRIARSVEGELREFDRLLSRLLNDALSRNPTSKQLTETLEMVLRATTSHSTNTTTWGNRTMAMLRLSMTFPDAKRVNCTSPDTNAKVEVW